MLQAGGDVFQIASFVDGQVLLRHAVSQLERYTTELELIDAMQRGEVTTQREALNSALATHLTNPQLRLLEAQHASEAQAAQLAAKVRWLQALKVAGIEDIHDEPWVRQKMARLHDTELSDLPLFAVSTLQRAQAQLTRAGGNVVSLLPNYGARGGRGQGRLNEVADRVVGEVLNGYVLAPSKRLIVTEVYDSVRARLQEINQINVDAPVPLPGRSTIARRVSREFSAHSICVRNHSSRFAAREFRNNPSRIRCPR